MSPVRIPFVLFAFILSVSSAHSQSNLYLRSGNPVNEYYRVPVMLDPQMHFSGYVDNLGDSSAVNVQVKVKVYNSTSTLVYTDSSTVTPFVNPGDSMLFTIPSFQPPASVDQYVTEFTATSTSIDAYPADNVRMLNDTFFVTDSAYARDNNNSYVPVSTSGNAGGFLGQQFIITQPALLTSISGYLFSALPCNVAFVLFSYDNGVPGLVPIATSDTFSLGPFPLWTTLALRNGPAYLSADTFVIAAQQFGSVYINLGLSDARYIPGSTWVRWPSLGGWENIELFGNEYAYPFMLRANLTEATSVEENQSQNNLPMVYPNPTNESVTITGAGNETIEITNALGQIVFSTKAIGTSTAVDVTKLEAGIYLVSVYSEDEKTTQQLIIE